MGTDLLVFGMLGGIAELRDEQIVYVNRGAGQVGREEKKSDAELTALTWLKSEKFPRQAWGTWPAEGMRTLLDFLWLLVTCDNVGTLF